MNLISLTHKSAVILSEGERNDPLSSQDSPEPQSKDLARPISDFEKRPNTFLLSESYSLLALSSRRNLPGTMEIHRNGMILLSFVARFFDCGSGESFDKDRPFLSPSLRMTDFFFKFTAKGATP